MTGCPAAIAAQPYREAEARCPELAYGLHLRGPKCSLIGGRRICGECAGEVGPQGGPEKRSREAGVQGKGFWLPQEGWSKQGQNLSVSGYRSAERD